MDVGAIGSLLGSLKTATDIAKFVRESSVSLERAELKMKLAELIEALANAKIEAADIQQEILDRDQQIRELQAAAAIEVELRWEQPCYFRKNEQGTEDPYCQNCKDSTGKLSRLHTDGAGYFHCRVCKQSFKTLERAQSDEARAVAATRGRGGRSSGRSW
jgi:uncharacterized protein YfcZ (UPF0381/DUF406 family)